MLAPWQFVSEYARVKAELEKHLKKGEEKIECCKILKQTIKSSEDMDDLVKREFHNKLYEDIAELKKEWFCDPQKILNKITFPRETPPHKDLGKMYKWFEKELSNHKALLLEKAVAANLFETSLSSFEGDEDKISHEPSEEPCLFQTPPATSQERARLGAVPKVPRPFTKLEKSNSRLTEHQKPKNELVNSLTHVDSKHSESPAQAMLRFATQIKLDLAELKKRNAEESIQRQKRRASHKKVVLGSIPKVYFPFDELKKKERKGTDMERSMSDTFTLESALHDLEIELRNIDMPKKQSDDSSDQACVYVCQTSATSEKKDESSPQSLEMTGNDNVPEQQVNTETHETVDESDLENAAMERSPSKKGKKAKSKSSFKFLKLYKRKK